MVYCCTLYVNKKESIASGEMRFVTTKEIMAKDTKNISEAWNLWDKVWANHRIAFLAEPGGLGMEFRKHSRLFSRSPKVWADAYLLAFASVTKGWKD